MKKSLFFAAILGVAVIVFNGCKPISAEFDEALLIGKWQSGTLYEVYNSDYTGSTWDASDDVSESEAQRFTWELDKSTLTQIHIMETTGEGTVPKVYTVTALTSTTLSYRDDYGKTKTFTKVKE